MRQARPREIITEQATEEKASNKARERHIWMHPFYYSFLLSLVVISIFFWTWQMQTMKHIQAIYQYCNRFLPYISWMEKRSLLKISKSNMIYKHAKIIAFSFLPIHLCPRLS